MEIVRRVNAMKQVARDVRSRGQRIGFVPTMGALHEGHLSLVRRAQELSDVVVVSVFVNPTQFNENDDFDRYPRDLTHDADLCVAEGVEYLFAPEAREIYSDGPRTTVEVEGLSLQIEGASRPGHFKGVATIVLKLLNILQPHVAVFGQKDAQQSAIVRRMVDDLMLDTEILIAPIVRDDDGLALSSRNARLDDAAREAARTIPRALDAVEQLVVGGQRDAATLIRRFGELIEAESLLELDYAVVVDPETFEPLSTVDAEALMVVAVHCDGVRLLDNVRLALPRPAEGDAAS